MVLAAMAISSSTTAAGPARAESGIVENDPDAGNARIAASVYWAMIARKYFNWGGHGQVTLSPTPAVELKGAGMLNLPSSGLALFRLEGSAYFAITSLDTANVVNSQSSDGVYVYTRYTPVPGALRKKFGLEIGGFFDRHGVFFYPMDDFRHDGDAPIPITQIGGFGGFKWVRQTNVHLSSGAAQWLRTAFFIHAMYAVKQSIDVPAGEPEPTYSKIGGRFGVEMSSTVGTGLFMRAEGGAMPSIRGPDWNMFIMLGVEHAENLF
ncbi:MAG: hypothetical protein ACXWUG_14430 [Polyangiales bacterium]